jgi:hypothetical protein
MGIQFEVLLIELWYFYRGHPELLEEGVLFLQESEEDVDKQVLIWVFVNPFFSISVLV